VAAGKFRQDLLFGLNTIQLHLPPLRERREDIELLAQHF
jgi:DNA-binding NtrC family response regulator